MRKMSIIRLDHRGQISAEYLLLFVVILTVLLFMISNFIGPTIDASNNVSAVSDTNVVVKSIADAVNVVYSNGPGAKRTLNVNVPQDMTLTFDSDNQVVTTNRDDLNYTQNGTAYTSKEVSAPMYYNPTDENKDITPLTLTKGWHTIQVYWNNTNGVFTVTTIAS